MEKRMAEPPIEIKESPWYEQTPASPQLGDDDFGLDIALRPATRDGKKTVALLGTYRLPGAYGERYGGRTTGAIQILAVSTTSGMLFFNKAESAHASPIRPQASRPAAPDAPELVAVEGVFNVDLIG